MVSHCRKFDGKNSGKLKSICYIRFKCNDRYVVTLRTVIAWNACSIAIAMVRNPTAQKTICFIINGVCAACACLLLSTFDVHTVASYRLLVHSAILFLLHNLNLVHVIVGKLWKSRIMTKVSYTSES